LWMRFTSSVVCFAAVTSFWSSRRTFEREEASCSDDA
jgi:hypothetical protein